MIRLSLCFLLLSLSIGCKTPRPSRHETEKAYAVHAVFIDAPSMLLEELNLSWILDSSKTVTTNTFEDSIQKLCSSPQARITEFPVVYVNAGERKKIDKQRPVKYPIEYTQDGKPADYETRGVGQLIEIDLKSVTNDTIQFSYHVEEVADPIWTSHNIGSSSRIMKQPIFHVRSISSSSDITLFPNQWLIGGGLITESKEGTKRNIIFAIQVQENKKTQPTNAPYFSPAAGSKR